MRTGPSLLNHQGQRPQGARPAPLDRGLPLILFSGTGQVDVQWTSSGPEIQFGTTLRTTLKLHAADGPHRLQHTNTRPRGRDDGHVKDTLTGWREVYRYPVPAHSLA